MVIVHVKDKERDFKWTPEAWKMVRNWFRDVEEFLRFEGLDPRGHILPGSHYIYQIEIRGIKKTSDGFNLVMADLTEHFPDLSFEVL